MANKSVVLQDVRKSYGNLKVVHGIDLTIAEGEFVVFVGPSGGGKSTLLRMIAGLEDVTDGEVEIKGRVVTDLDPSERGIAMVFQSYALYPHMSVRDNLAFGLKMARTNAAEIETRVKAASAILKIDHLLDRRPGQLSGGQRQRVAIGRAIVRKPDVFLFDEPLSNLDAELRVSMRIEIARLHRELGNTMIYVTHDQTEALTFADKVVVMLEGTVVQIGSPIELFERPRHTFVGHFIGSPGMNVMPCAVEAETVRIGTHAIAVQNRPAAALNGQRVEIGVRPEFVSFANEGLPVEIVKVADAGRYRIVDARHGTSRINVLVTDGAALPGEGARVRFDPAHTRLYADGWLVE